MNQVDFVADYEDAAADSHVGRAARRRIHWLCGSIEGDRVLDLSMSGVVPAVLLARSGKTVVDVEPNEAAVDEAQGRLESEEPSVRGRVTLVRAHADDLSGHDGTFDTVLLGDGFSDEAEVGPLVERAQRALRDDGLALVAAPYGINRYHDQDEPPGLRAYVATLTTRFTIDEVHVDEGYLGMTARLRPDGGRVTVDPWLDALQAVYRRLEQLQRAIDGHAEDTAERDRTARNERAARERTEGHAARLEERLAATKDRHEAERERVRELKAKVAERDSALRDARAQAAEAKQRLEKLRSSRSFRAIRLLWRARSAASRPRRRPIAAKDRTSGR